MAIAGMFRVRKFVIYFAVAVAAARCAPTNQLKIDRGTATFSSAFGVNGTYAWDSLSPLAKAADGGVTTVTLTAAGPREAFIFDRLPPFPGAPVDPPELFPIHYASTPAPAVPAPTAVTSRSAVMPTAARAIDHGACNVPVPWVTGPQDAAGVVLPTPDNAGDFFPQIAQQLLDAFEAETPDDRNAKSGRRDAIYQPRFAQQAGGDSSSNDDGFFIWEKIYYTGLRTIFGIPYEREVTVGAHFTIFATGGDVRVVPINVVIGGDIPDEKKAVAEAQVRETLPARVNKAIHDRVAIPVFAKCEPGDDGCCQKQGPAGLAATLTFSGTFKAPEAERIANHVARSRFFSSDDGTCKFSPYVRWVNVLPDKFELVLSATNEPLSADALAFQVAPERNCRVTYRRVDYGTVTTYRP